MKRVLYFAYGSNMDPDRMRERRVAFYSRRRAVLEGWRLEFNKAYSKDPRQGFANIVRDEGGVVEGVLYEVDEKGLERLDLFEGFPRHYGRVRVNVKLDEGGVVEAEAYVAKPEWVRSGLRPSKEYLEHLLRGCDLLSEEYCKKLRSVETLD